MPRPRVRTRSLLSLCAAALAACSAPPLASPDYPVVEIQTPQGHELGVCTDDGVLCLGRTAESGPAKVTYMLGPTPLVEAGEIEPVAGTIHRVKLQVTVPSVAISFEPIRPGEPLVLMGFDNGFPWQHDVYASDDEVVQGTAIQWSADKPFPPRYVGAGVFRDTPGGLTIVGLVKGLARVENGPTYLLLAGLPEFRLAIAKPASAVPSRRVIYRDDGLRVHRIVR